MAAGGSPTVQWSDKTYSIAEIINEEEFDLPLLVKVEEGICSDNDSESFSQDDLLKFDSVKSIPKVVACCVDYRGRNRMSSVIREDEHGYAEKTVDFTIPLRYKGVVQIVHPESGTKIYHNISEVLKDLPRYVKVVDSFVSKNNISVQSKSIIEVDRKIPDEGLVCYMIDDDLQNSTNRIKLVFDLDDTCSFFLLPDKTYYTLEEVAKRFPLPQYVTFMKESGPKLVTTNIQEAVEHSRIFEGTVKIKKLIEQKTIIGHYKPPEQEELKTQSLCQRTLIIIPLDSPTAREIEVRVPLDVEDDDQYELVLARNFSQMNIISEENIDGTIYVDFLKTPKATFVHYDEIEFVPPRPPRTKVKKDEETQGDYLEIDEAELLCLKENKDEDEEEDYLRVFEAEPLCLEDADKEKGKSEVRLRETTTKTATKVKHRFSLRRMHHKLLKMSRRTSSDTVTETHRERFASLTSMDMYNCLLKINMVDMAKCCLDNGFNGVFFNSVTDEQLKTDFNLSPIQVMKFRRFQNKGWLPQ
ncbi:uncharacterized protein LOC110442013 isoform X2 [Mizuhopecten yessoensis]|uniref:uncharacterized protein LOC110442013 isoform X2 n=1 Tax=Mizuhopecten yessoensis TaxID=6573 RepID=UPI000B45E035|nr:uncharacterized protein LOC110442013 isoform X2 [Mizuhopecten yessoensis]